MLSMDAIGRKVARANKVWGEYIHEIKYVCGLMVPHRGGVGESDGGYRGKRLELRGTSFV